MMKRSALKSLLPLSLLWACSIPAQAETQDQVCGTIDYACEVDLGTYNIALPKETTSDNTPAVIFFHGAGRSGADTLKNTTMIKAMNNRGYAVIAPSGLKRPNSRFGPGWSFIPQREKMRDELAFTRAVLKDAESKFNIDRNNILMSGFSIGGSLVWYLACQDASIASAYAPVAGAFWWPQRTAQDCSGPIKLMHTHGWRDKTVPLEGRPLAGGAIRQGDVFQALQTVRKINGCEGLRADEFDTSTLGKMTFWQRWWTRCTPNSNLRFVLHQGGHTIPKGWTTMALNWFEKIKTGSSQTN